MSLILVTLLMAQTVGAAAQPPATSAVKEKPKQVCEYLEITGSRAKERVCHDVGGTVNLEGYGVSNSAYGKAAITNADPHNAPSSPK